MQAYSHFPVGVYPTENALPTLMHEYPGSELHHIDNLIARSHRKPRHLNGFGQFLAVYADLIILFHDFVKIRQIPVPCYEEIHFR